MATPTQLAEAEAWLSQMETGARELDARMVAATWAAYEVVDDWENPSQTLAAATAAAATSRAAQQMHAGLASEFVANVVSIFTGRRPSVPRRTPTYPRRAEPFDVYSRPVFEFRDALARDLSEDLALIEAQQRAEVISLTDALLARRDASVAVLEAEPLVTHYRRVIRPERSETGTCGLCIAAASRIYSVKELMPVHTRCKCEVIGVVGTDDAAERFNLADMQELYGEIPGTTKAELVRTRYTVEDDGELGPTLLPTRRSEPVSTQTVDNAGRAAKELAALLPVLDSLEARAAAGEDVSKPLAYQRGRVAKLRDVVAGSAAA